MLRSFLGISHPLLPTLLPPPLTWSRRASVQVLALVDAVSHESGSFEVNMLDFQPQGEPPLQKLFGNCMY